MYVPITSRNSLVVTGRVYIPASGVGSWDSVAVALRGAQAEYWASLLYGTGLAERNSIDILRNDVHGMLYPLTLVPGWYTVKVSVDYAGSAMRMKAWVDGDNEPASWQVSRALDSGWVVTEIGFRHYGQGTYVDDLVAVQDLDLPRAAPESMAIAGPSTGAVGSSYTFIVAVTPPTATTPLTYTWQATEQSPVTHTAGLSDTAAFAWTTAGTKLVTVTATNEGGSITGTFAVNIVTPLEGVSIAGRTSGAVNVSYPFTANVTPLSATTPITYVWQATGYGPVTHTGGLSDTIAFAWETAGTKSITVTTTNRGGSVSDSHTIAITSDGTPTPTYTPTATSTPLLVTAEGTVTRAEVSFCIAPSHVLPESGTYLVSHVVDLEAYIGRYVRVWGWEVANPECYVIEVISIEITSTPTPTWTPTYTPTLTWTPSHTPTHTSTYTPSPTPTITSTWTPTVTPTNTPVYCRLPLVLKGVTPTPTRTPYGDLLTPGATPTRTATPRPNLRPIAPALAPASRPAWRAAMSCSMP